MSKETFYKHFTDIENERIVEVSRRIVRAKLYKINFKHPLAAALREYERKVSTQAADKEIKRLIVG